MAWENTRPSEQLGQRVWHGVEDACAAGDEADLEPSQQVTLARGEVFVGQDHDGGHGASLARKGGDQAVAAASRCAR